MGCVGFIIVGGNPFRVAGCVYCEGSAAPLYIGGHQGRSGILTSDSSPMDLF